MRIPPARLSSDLRVVMLPRSVIRGVIVDARLIADDRRRGRVGPGMPGAARPARDHLIGVADRAASRQ